MHLPLHLFLALRVTEARDSTSALTYLAKLTDFKCSFKPSLSCQDLLWCRNIQFDCVKLSQMNNNRVSYPQNKVS